MLSFTTILTTDSMSVTNEEKTVSTSTNQITQKVKQRTLTESTNPVLQTANMSASWQELGPVPLENSNGISTWGSSPYSGRVTAIAINSSNSEEIYLGTAQGGVWKSLDGGSSWIPLMDQQDSLAIGSIAISPDQNTLYVGTGEGNHAIDNYAGIGLLKSTDGGKSWIVLGSTYFSGSSISSIAIRPTNPDYILVATTSGNYAKGLAKSANPNGLGVYLSTNGGVSWTRTLSQLSTATNGVAELVVNASDDTIIYASDFGGYVWQSVNSGVTWTSYIHESVPANQGRVAIAMSPANPDYLYAVFVNSTGEVIDMVSYNGVFTNFNPLPDPTSLQYGPCGGQCWYNLLIKVDPNNANTIYVGTNNLYKSADGGTSWSFLGGAEVNGNLHPDMHAFAFKPVYSTIIYSGNDGGIYKSIDAGYSWTSLNSNLGTIQFNSIAASPTEDTHLLGGVQDNACNIYTNNTSWTIAAGGDGGAAMFFSDNQMACNYVKLDPRFSYDNGGHFSPFISGLNSNDPVLFYAPMVQDPNNLYTLYLGSNRIYKLTETATSWSDISGQISDGKISAIAVAKTNGQILLEGDNNGIVKLSTNGGSTWNQVFSTKSFYSKTIPITSVAIDPIDSSIMFVAIANQTNDKMFYTIDQGSTWNYFYLTGVPEVAINVIKVNPITDVLFIGTDRGLYYLNEIGNWNTLGTGLPNAAIFDLTFTASNYLVVGTHGRGVWLNYMTPFINTDLTNNTSYQSGKQVAVSITDPNGYSNATYHWDTGVNTTAASTFVTNIPTNEGQHILYVYAKDPAGNWGTEKFYFRTDNTAPSISLSTASNNSEIEAGSTIGFQVTDDSPLHDIWYHWNDNSDISLPINNGHETVTIPATTGQATLTITANDTASNSISQTFSFTIIPPTTTSGSGGTSPGFEIVILIPMIMGLAFRKKNPKN